MNRFNKLNTPLFHFLLVIFSLISPPSVLNASHIVGGDISYRFIERQGENSRYAVTIKTYYDCYNFTSPTVQDPVKSDSVIQIAVYQKMTHSPELWRLVGTGGSLRLFNVSRSPLRKLNNPLFDCVLSPDNVCVFEGVFEFEVILKRIPMPYVITYQRCCRNATISNLVQPSSTGFNIFTELTPEAQAADNSTPTFRNYPNTVICANEPLRYDHSVVEPDGGDRIVYRFCPTTSSPGIAIGNRVCYPAPTTNNHNCPPPIMYATYAGTRTWSNPILGAPDVTIDSLTGMITGVPLTLGQHVVTVCAEEYRGNVLMSRIFRDFQFNTLVCPKKVETRMQFADSVQYVGTKRFFLNRCDTASLILPNDSRFPQYINSFYWEFNIGGQNRRYTEWQPRLIFPDTGMYRGSLWLNRGELCHDSAYVDVLIGSGLKPKWDLQFDSCAAKPILLTNKTDAPYLRINLIRWDLTDTFAWDTSTLTYQFKTYGRRNISLKVANPFGCSETLTQSLLYQPLPNRLAIHALPAAGCVPLTVPFQNFSPPFDTSLRFRWDFGDGSPNATLNNPSHVYNLAGQYVVKFIVSNSYRCEKTEILRGGINAYSPPKADFDFMPKTVSEIKGTVNFEDKSSNDVTAWLWQFGTRGTDNVKNPTFTFTDTGNLVLKLIATNLNGCSDTVSKSLFVEPYVSFFMPNAFSPNFDGLNDEFRGKGFLQSAKDFSMTIFNRWGEVVFKTTNFTEGWNGQHKNSGYASPEGVYTYLVVYKNFSGEQRTLTNTFVLTR